MTWKTILPALSALLLIAASGPTSAAEPVSVSINEWDGFIGCGIGTPLYTTTSLCQVDANHNNMHSFDASGDLKTIVVALEWSNTLAPNDLEVELAYRDGAPHTQSGGSPIEFRLDAGEDFDAGDTDLPWVFRVNPSSQGSFVYQQTFTVHYDLFYGAHASEGYSAL